jgi:hypothetical protein
VYADGERQFVVEDGERVYGLYVIPEEDRCDLPLFVEAGSQETGPKSRDSRDIYTFADLAKS